MGANEDISVQPHLHDEMYLQSEVVAINYVTASRYRQTHGTMSEYFANWEDQRFNWIHQIQ